MTSIDLNYNSLKQSVNTADENKDNKKDNLKDLIKQY